MLNFKSILPLLLVSDVAFGGFLNIDMKKCLKRNGLFPKVGSYCKSYYKCTNWIPVEITCPEDEVFNPISGWCDWVEAFPCLDKPKRKECPRENGKFLKPGTNCRSFYVCCNGEPTEITCPPDTLFDPSNEKCEWTELYTCSEGISTKDIISSTSNPILKSSTNVVRTSSISTSIPDQKTSHYPDISSPSSPRTTFKPYTKLTTNNIQFSSTASDSTDDETNQSPDFSSPRSTFDPNTKSTSDVKTVSSTSKHTTSYETSQYTDISRPQTTFHPSTQYTTDDIQFSSLPTDSTNYETTIPDTSSPKATFDPYTETDEHTTDERKSSILSTDTSDYKTSQHPESSSYRTSLPYTRSSIAELPDTTSAPYEPTSSYGTFEPDIKTSSAIAEETSQPIDIWCPEPSGYFPHPTDKHKFVGCVDGKPSVLTCPANLVYSHKVKRCVYQ